MMIMHSNVRGHVREDRGSVASVGDLTKKRGRGLEAGPPRSKDQQEGDDDHAQHVCVCVC